MQTFFVAFVSVALAELGDKTQLLALVLAAKYRRPVPIALGILLATVANHALAGFIGVLIAKWLTPEIVRWTVGLSLVAIAAWTLVPDKADESDADRGAGRSVLIATAISFFLAEMGDKTQIATAVIAAEYHPLWQVVAGTTLGMLAADVPVIWLGATFAHRLPLKATRIVAAFVFAAMGIWILLA